MPALTLAVLVMRRSALSMRLVTVVLVLLPVGSGVVLVSAAALVMLPLPVETCTVRVRRCAGAAGQAAQGSRSGRAAGLQCAHAVSGADQGQADQGVGQGDVGGCARPGVVEGDDVAEGPPHGAGADAGGLVMRRSALSMRLVTVVLGVVAGVGSGWCWSAPPRW